MTTTIGVATHFQKPSCAPLAAIASGLVALAVFKRASKGKLVGVHQSVVSINAAQSSSEDANACVFSDGHTLQQHFMSAARGSAFSSTSGRGALLTCHAYTKRGPYAKLRRREMWLKYSKHMKGKKRNCYRFARQAVLQGLKQKYKSRIHFKRMRRRLWIMRVNANCKLHGVSYARFICNLKRHKVALNRKILSQLGVYDRGVFTNVMDVAKPEWRKFKKRHDAPPKQYTAKDADDVIIPYIEKCVPELYTDACIRFNRKVKPFGIEYTVDMGDPKMWQNILPKFPELSNFEIPDHFLSNHGQQMEFLPLDLLKKIQNAPDSEDYKKFRHMVESTWEEDKAREERGEPTWPKKEGVSREDWFKEEPQSWFTSQ